MAHSSLPNTIYIVVGKIQLHIGYGPLLDAQNCVFIIFGFESLLGRISCYINLEPLRFKRTGCKSQVHFSPNIKMISSRGIAAGQR